MYRGGCFDALEREPKNDMPCEFAWLNTKDFWQQEQGILAYLILHGRTGRAEYLELAQEMAAFWNIFFLDLDRGGVFFRTTDDGLPVTEGMYGDKGGHAISGYHAFELSYLAHVYLMTYVRKEPLVMHFKPTVGQRHGYAVNVLPDFMGPNDVELTRVVVDGVERPVEDKRHFVVKLDESCDGVEVTAELTPLASSR